MRDNAIRQALLEVGDYWSTYISSPLRGAELGPPKVTALPLSFDASISHPHPDFSRGPRVVQAKLFGIKFYESQHVPVPERFAHEYPWCCTKQVIVYEGRANSGASKEIDVSFRALGYHCVSRLRFHYRCCNGIDLPTPFLRIGEGHVVRYDWITLRLPASALLFIFRKLRTRQRNGGWASIFGTGANYRLS
jgi:hypothetical protein